MPPVIITALTTGLVALIPKALTDAYDYFFNGEEIQVKKVPDRTKFTRENYIIAHREYGNYIDDRDMTQKELTDKLNRMFGTNKSVAQMMRICRSDP
jgi:hypothetical protein